MLRRSMGWYAANFISLPVIAAWVWLIADLTGFIQ